MSTQQAQTRDANRAMYAALERMVDMIEEHETVYIAHDTESEPVWVLEAASVSA